MKLNTKTIIIILVVAVAAYLIWKNKKRTVEVTETVVSAGGGEDHTSLSYILSHIAFTEKERNAIEAKRQSVESTDLKRQSMQAKAYQQGHTYDQQIVLDAIWSLYNPTNTAWEAGPNGRTDYGWNLQQKVLNL